MEQIVHGPFVFSPLFQKIKLILDKNTNNNPSKLTEESSLNKQLTSKPILHADSIGLTENRTPEVENTRTVSEPVAGPGPSIGAIGGIGDRGGAGWGRPVVTSRGQLRPIRGREKSELTNQRPE